MDPGTWISRQFAFLMYSSNGAFTHASIMALPWRLLGVYQDAFTYLNRQQSEKGRQDNARDDLRSMGRDPRVKAAKQNMIDETKRRTQKIVERVEKGIKGKVVRSGTLDSLAGKKK